MSRKLVQYTVRQWRMISCGIRQYDSFDLLNMNSGQGTQLEHLQYCIILDLATYVLLFFYEAHS